MNIIFVTNQLATDQNASGGLASFTTNISRIFKSKGHTVSIIFFSTKEVNIPFDKEIPVMYIYFQEKMECV